MPSAQLMSRHFKNLRPLSELKVPFSRDEHELCLSSLLKIVVLFFETTALWSSIRNRLRQLHKREETLWRILSCFPQLTFIYHWLTQLFNYMYIHGILIYNNRVYAHTTQIKHKMSQNSSFDEYFKTGLNFNQSVHCSLQYNM